MPQSFRVALYFNMALVHHQGMANGIIRYARNHGDWELFGAYWPMYRISDYHSWQGDGIIAAVETPGDIEKLTASGIPVVDTSGAILDPRLSLVTNDNPEIGRVGGSHLVLNGLERFVFCAAKGSTWSDERLAGFDQATRAARTGKLAVFRRKYNWWYTPEYSRALAQFLSRQRFPIGLMAANDTIGMNVVGAARLAGIRIPEDVALVSVDNEELLCELSTPPMSSIPFNRQEIGYRAAERLDQLMRGVISEAPELRIKPYPLVERASSAVTTARDAMVVEAVAFIRQNAGMNLSAGEVADKLFTSRRNLERRFKDQLGRTILEEIHRARINLAKRLFREGEASAKRVAGLSGFRTLDRFSAIFTRYAGVSPSVYRDRSREERSE